MTTRLTAALMAAALTLAAPAYGAAQLEPGQWQDTETGTEDGKPVAPEVTTSCMPAEEAQDVVKALTQLQHGVGQQCKAMHVDDKGSTLSFDMECGEAKTMLIAVKLNITFLSSRHYTGTVKSQVAYLGKTISSDKKLDSKWISATCEKQ